VLFVGSSTLLVVDQRHLAVVYSHGGGNPALVGPGLHVKLPSPLQSALVVDTRVQSLETGDVDRYATSDKTDLLVSPVLKYRIADPLKLFNQMGGDIQGTSERLTTLVRGALADAFGKRTLADALAHQREIASEAQAAIAGATGSLGIDINDLQLERVDFTAAGADAAYKRMIAAREQAASEERAQGAAEAAQIRADAERSRDAILADAYKAAQSMKGDGDAKAAAIAAEAFSRDPGFYQFYQSLQAYRAVFKPNDVIVVDPDSDFFRFMRSPEGGTASPPSATGSRKH
jgi:membrane protease subunit HflC